MLYWFNFLEKLIISVSTASSLCEAQASSIQALGSSLVNQEVEGVGCTILSEMSSVLPELFEGIFLHDSILSLSIKLWGLRQRCCSSHRF